MTFHQLSFLCFVVGLVLTAIVVVRRMPDGPPPKGARWHLYTHHLGSYMHRWIFLTPWGSLRLHHILRSDADRHLHDHPFSFTSFLLTGGYTEIRPKVEYTGRSRMTEDGNLLGGFAWKLGYDNREPRERVWFPRFSIVRKFATQAHLLELTRPVWTLVLTGPKIRRWGFHTEKGWIYHREYSAAFPENAASTKAPASSASLRLVGAPVTEWPTPLPTTPTPSVMKITITGPAGIGKSSLASWLLGRLEQLPVLADEVIIETSNGGQPFEEGRGKLPKGGTS